MRKSFKVATAFTGTAAAAAMFAPVPARSPSPLPARRDLEGYPKLSLKKYKPIAARNEDVNVSRGLL
jgi:hypothetical protein